ncbi:aminopeptidase [Desemzia sp. RIT804]|uniref:aminopeptidase n=1 Tax=Desemzia sp. RIT 804 TaxID=2810209 RepID=UPI00194E7C03|nr:aminopeptidase [Desemzia sp. RIT 804]MBM6613842.1 aminopeptidase [Desemzia sp. RIT 804]
MYLNNYAKIIVNVGIAVEKGELVKINFSPEHLPLVREISKEAYKSGAQYVALDLRDSEIKKNRARYLADEFLETFPNSIVENELNYAKSGYSTITIVAPSFSDGDSNEIERASMINRAKLIAMSPRRTYGMENNNKWVVVNAPTKEWAQQVFPEHPENEAIELLWKYIYETTKSNTSDPVAAWEQHDAALKNKAEQLNNFSFFAIRYISDKTNLTVSLVKNHIWLGGSEQTSDGKTFMSNIPVEEVWTMPNKYEVNGYVAITKPLILAGKTIGDLKFFFENGRVASIEPKDQVVLDLLNTDEGAGMLGEVALVSASSGIAQTGITFKSTLFDENAACHIALGQAYLDNISVITNEDLDELGMNKSAIHEDVMIGDNSMDVYGLLDDEEILIMRNGEWQI